MKTLYYTILMRPVESHTWTPLDISRQERPAGNFFAAQEDAVGFCNRLASKGMWKYSPEAKTIVGVELKVASVRIDDDTPTSTCPPPKAVLQ